MLQIADITAAILAGGLATRLGAVTQDMPKALIPVAGKPFIEHQLELLRRNGVRNVVLCAGHLGEKLQQHVGDGGRWGLSVRYSFDGEQLVGTGGALRRAVPLLGEVFWVMYGDSYMEIDYRAVLSAFDRHPDAQGLMTVLHNGGRWDKSNVLFENGRLVRYDKKDTTGRMEHIDYGIALLRREAAGRIGEGRSDIADLYTSLVNEGRMIGFEVSQRFYEIGTPESWAEADRHLKARVGK